jgi:glycosyltransferase involved in cell wall biosynthesis
MTPLAQQPPKRVLLVIRWPVGGIRTFVRYVFRNFDHARWHFTIMAPAHYETEAMRADLAGLDLRYIPLKQRPGTAGFLSRVSREILHGGYDLVHSQGFTAGLCAALPALLSRTPHLMTSHDVINPEQFCGVQGRLKRRGMARLFGSIDAIHSVSHDAQANLLEYFPGLAGRRGKCVVIPNGIEVDRFISAPPRDLRAELGLADDVFLIGFFGRFMKQKGFRYLVDAAALLRRKADLPRPFLVLTFGDGGFIREERQALEAKGLAHCFRFMPFTHNVAGAIKGLDAVAMPSLWEACPLLAMESLTSGTPVIASGCIGLREVLRDTPARVVKPLDGKTLADEIFQEINHPSKKGHQAFVGQAAKRFDVKQMSRDLESIYEKLLFC